MRSRVASLPTRAVRYLESGSGRPLIWIHAFPLSADQWLPQLHRVPPGWRFVAPDLRGFRGTGPTDVESRPGDPTLDDYANDIVALMDHLDLRQAVIGGLSMGGYVAFALWRRHRARVAGLVLACTRAGADTAEGRAARDAMLVLVRQDGAAGVAAAMLPKLLSERTRAEQPDLADAVAAMIRANPTEAIAAAIRAMRDRPDSTPLLATVDCPTTIVAGEDDVLIPPTEAEVLHRAIAGSRLVTVAGAGHLANLEAPVAFNEAVADTL